MPIHLIWGDDIGASEREIERLIESIVDPAWSQMNLSRLDGSDTNQANKALEEARTPPFGNGGRVVLLKRSPFCNNCPSHLANILEKESNCIPENTHLILNNPNKPDGRLKSTKVLQSSIKSKKAFEKSFQLPTIWDIQGQKDLIKRIATEHNLEIDSDAISLLIDSIGNDSTRLSSEFEKLALYISKNQKKDETCLVKLETVQALVTGKATNALQIGNLLLENNYAEAIILLDHLIDSGEHPLRIISTLTGQARGWLWVKLLEQQGEKDVSIIAKAAGIANPRRIYVMRKQLNGRHAKQFLNLLTNLLEIEAGLKKGASPKDIFRDWLLAKN